MALWFGALFGLGSLAIRPGLLESLVISGHIDSVIPAAAPPLGITARILLALAMGGIGVVLGFLIARKLAQPKQETRERRRGVGDKAPVRTGAVKVRQRDAHPDAPARRPISAHEEFGDEPDSEQPALTPSATLPGRRRSLTIEDNSLPDYHDLAPLPGGDPAVLDMGDFAQLDAGPDADMPSAPVQSFGAPAAFPEPAAFANPAPAVDPAFAQPYATPSGITPATPRMPAPAEPQESGGFAAPFAKPAAFAPPAPFDQPPRFDQPAAFAPPAAFSAPDEGAGDASADSAKSAATMARLAFPESEPVFAAPAEAASDAIGQPATGLFAKPFAAPPLFAPTEVTSPPEPVASAPLAAPFAAAQAASADAAIAPAVMATAEPAPVAAPAPMAEKTAFAMPEGHAADRINAAELGVLSPVELIERLALSLQRRRNATEAAPQADVDGIASPEAPATADAIVPPPFAMPEALANPAAAAEPEVPAESAPPPAMSLPAAFRPFEIADADDDGDDMASLLPPRMLGKPAQPAPAPEPALAAPDLAGSNLAAPDLAVSADDDFDEDDDGFSSLLDLGTPTHAPRAGFVRIEEPASAPDSVEPVVIFPGHGGRGSAFAGPNSAPMTAVSAVGVQLAPHEGNSATMGTVQVAIDAQQQALRRFDAPGSNGVIGQDAPAAQGPAHDPEETERALRAALATLQRMSGAA